MTKEQITDIFANAVDSAPKLRDGKLTITDDSGPLPGVRVVYECAGSDVDPSRCSST
jgi:hypothetical protein